MAIFYSESTSRITHTSTECRKTSRSSSYKLVSVYFSIQLIADVYAGDISFSELLKVRDKASILGSAMVKPNPTISANLLTGDPYFVTEHNIFRNSKSSAIPLESSLDETMPSSGLKKKKRKKTKKDHKLRRLGKKLLRKNSRHRRRRNTKGWRHKHEGLSRRSCPTKLRYDYKETAIDMFGDTVQVYPYIHIGSLSIDQYFYETFCDEEKCECSGIDNKKYKSSCETDYSFTYARVIKGGEIGWTHIKVRSGCSCVIREVQSARMINIVDLI